MATPALTVICSWPPFHSELISSARARSSSAIAWAATDEVRGQQEAELLAAEAGRDAASRRDPLKGVGEGRDQLVTGEVTVPVVDDAQMVEVDHQQRQGRRGASGLRDRAVDLLREVDGVVEARLGVGARAMSSSGT